MTEPCPSQTSHVIPLYIRYVACDQWIRLRIDSTATIATLKDDILTKLQIGQYEPTLGVTAAGRPSSSRHVGETDRQAPPDRSKLATAVIPVIPHRSFLARAPDAVLQASAARAGAKHSFSTGLFESASARKRAEGILHGDPGRGGPGSLPRTEMPIDSAPSFADLEQASSNPSIAMNAINGKVSTDQPPTRLNNKAFSGRESRSADSDSKPSPSRVRQAKSAESPSPKQVPTRVVLAEVGAGLNGKAGALYHAGSSEYHHDMTAASGGHSKLQMARDVGPPMQQSGLGQDGLPYCDRSPSYTLGASHMLSGNESAKQREEAARRILEHQLLQTSALTQSVTAAQSVVPILNTSTSESSIEMQLYRSPVKITANARRAQRAKQRAMEYLVADDAVWTPDENEEDETEARLVDPAGIFFSSESDSGLSCSVPRGGATSSFDEVHHSPTRTIGSDRTSSGAIASPLPFASLMSDVSSEFNAGNVSPLSPHSPQSPQGSRGASPLKWTHEEPRLVLSQRQQIKLETRDEERLWGTQLEADLKRKASQTTTIDAGGQPTHPRVRSGTLRASTMQSKFSDDPSVALVERMSAPSLSTRADKAVSAARSLPPKPASAPSFPSSGDKSSLTITARASSRMASSSTSFIHSASTEEAVDLDGRSVEKDALSDQDIAGYRFQDSRLVETTPEHHPLSCYICLVSFSNGNILQDNATIKSCRLRPFELLEVQPQQLQDRLRLPRRSDATDSGTRQPRQNSWEGVESAASTSWTSQLRHWPLLDWNYLEPFAHGWVYIYQPGVCTDKVRSAGLGAWKLRWLILFNGKLRLYRRKAVQGSIATSANNSGRTSVIERGDEEEDWRRTAGCTFIAEWNICNILWVDSERADGATCPSARPLADDLLNVAFRGYPPLKYGSPQVIHGKEERHIISLRFLTPHQSRCWYSIFQKALLRTELTKRNGILSAKQLIRLPLTGIKYSEPDSELGPAGVNFVSSYYTDCSDTFAEVSIDSWRQRAFFRSFVAGRGGIVMPGKTGRNGGLNALTRVQPYSLPLRRELEDADTWSDDSEEESTIVIKAARVTTLAEQQVQSVTESNETSEPKTNGSQEVIERIGTIEERESREKLGHDSTAIPTYPFSFSKGSVKRPDRSPPAKAASVSPPLAPMRNTFVHLAQSSAGRRRSCANLVAVKMDAVSLSTSHSCTGRMAGSQDIIPEVHSSRVDLVKQSPSRSATQASGISNLVQTTTPHDCTIPTESITISSASSSSGATPTNTTKVKSGRDSLMLPYRPKAQQQPSSQSSSSPSSQTPTPKASLFQRSTTLDILPATPLVPTRRTSLGGDGSSSIVSFSENNPCRDVEQPLTPTAGDIGSGTSTMEQPGASSGLSVEAIHITDRSEPTRITSTTNLVNARSQLAPSSASRRASLHSSTGVPASSPMSSSYRVDSHQYTIAEAEETRRSTSRGSPASTVAATSGIRQDEGVSDYGRQGGRDRKRPRGFSLSRILSRRN